MARAHSAEIAPVADRIMFLRLRFGNNFNICKVLSLRLVFLRTIGGSVRFTRQSMLLFVCSMAFSLIQGCTNLKTRGHQRSRADSIAGAKSGTNFAAERQD